MNSLPCKCLVHIQAFLITYPMCTYETGSHEKEIARSCISCDQCHKLPGPTAQRAVSALNVAFCLNVSTYVPKLLCKD